MRTRLRAANRYALFVLYSPVACRNGSSNRKSTNRKERGANQVDSRSHVHVVYHVRTTDTRRGNASSLGAGNDRRCEYESSLSLKKTTWTVHPWHWVMPLDACCA